MKRQYFSIGKELYESVLIFAKLLLIESVIPLFFAYQVLNLITNFVKPPIMK